jgi:5-methyltetrahydropteroyltriglutamate--homocysteine methyltransferase
MTPTRLTAPRLPLLPTTVVGSYPQPDWLVDRDLLMSVTPPRVRLDRVWRVESAMLEGAQDDATRLAILDMETAGIDIVSDGEIRRESYFNRFATALDGIDLDNPGMLPDRTGTPIPVPRVVGPIRRRGAVQVRDTQFLRRHAAGPIKMTVPGPFTMTQLAINEHYPDARSLALAYAEAVNAELKDIKAAGADFVQIDEPYLQAKPDAARAFGLEAIDRAFDGIEGPTIVHMCFGYAYAVKAKPSGYSFLPELDRCCAGQVSIEAAQPKLDPATILGLPSKAVMLGVLDLGSDAIETRQTVADRIRTALAHVSPDRLVIAPDCGMKYLPRDVAFAKLRAMVRGTRLVRREL